MACRSADSRPVPVVGRGTRMVCRTSAVAAAKVVASGVRSVASEAAAASAAGAASGAGSAAVLAVVLAVVAAVVSLAVVSVVSVAASDILLSESQVNARSSMVRVDVYLAPGRLRLPKLILLPSPLHHYSG
jgi:hypothetical protein